MPPFKKQNLLHRGGSKTAPYDTRFQILIWRWDRLNFKRLLLGARPAARARCAAGMPFLCRSTKKWRKKGNEGFAPRPRAAEPRNGSARSIPNAPSAFGTRASKALSCKRLRRVRISRREPRWVLPPTTRGQDLLPYLAALQREHPNLTSFMALHLFPQHLTRGVQTAERAILERAKAKVSQKLFACLQ